MLQITKEHKEVIKKYFTWKITLEEKDELFKNIDDIYYRDLTFILWKK